MTQTHQAQVKMSTSWNRYPPIFRGCQRWAQARFGPSMNEGALRILSFGCSDGAEMSTLRAYFPSAMIFGCDLDRAAFDRNVGGQRSGVYFDSTEENVRGHGPYDLIVANSVLCLTEPNIQEAFPFRAFAHLCKMLHESLRDGGLFCAYNCSYLFSDLSFSAAYRPVRLPEIATNGWVPKWSPYGFPITSIYRHPVDGRRLSQPQIGGLSEADLRDCLFEKAAGDIQVLPTGSEPPRSGLELVGTRRILTDSLTLVETLYRQDEEHYWAERHWIAPYGETEPWWERASPEMLGDGVPTVLGQTSAMDDRDRRSIDRASG